MLSIGHAARIGNARAVPRRLLLSDPARLPDPMAAARRLPRAAGVLARDLPEAALRALARLCRARGLVLLVGGDGRAALRHHAGLHVPDRRTVRGLLPFLAARRAGAGWAALSAAAHGRVGLARGRRLQADWLLLSPVFPTRSHPGAAVLGPWRFAALAARAGRPVLALGGMTAARARRLPRAMGFAAIGGLS
jgi:thiamine-phosphate pyrophosphorylase